jgi:pullulanase
MSRSFRDLLKFSVPVLLAAALLSGCGSGSSGSADLGQGPSVESPPPPVTVTETFNFSSPNSFFVVGTPPTHARFAAGVASGNGAWVIPSGQTGVVDFGTPADAIKFSTQDNFTTAAAIAVGAQKTTLPRAPQQAVDAPFDTAMYIRGNIAGDWAVLPEHQLQEVSPNILAVTIPIEAGDYQFKVADAGWTGATNCGGSENPTPVPLGSAFTLGCSNGSQNLAITIATAGDYVFTFNTTAGDKTAPSITVARDTGGGGGGGGEPAEPDDSTEIRVYAVDVLTPGAKPSLLKTVKGVGKLDVDELRQGGATRITRIEIENKGTAGAIGVADFAWTASPRFAPDPVPVGMLYRRPLPGQTAGTKITVNGTTYDCVPYTEATEFECKVEGIPLLPYSNATMTVVNADGTTETILFNADDGNGPGRVSGDIVWAVSGSTVARNGFPMTNSSTVCAAGAADEVTLYYKRPDKNYTGWGLHLFPLEPPGPAWTVFPTPGEFKPETIDDEWGACFRIVLPGREPANNRYSNNPAPIDTFPTALGFIIHKGDTKDPGPDQVIRIGEQGNLLFVVSGVTDVSSIPPGGGTVLRVAGAAAHWVDDNSLLWSPPAGVTKVELLSSPDASINAGLQGITGNFETIALTSGTNPQPAFNKELNSLKAWDLPAAAVQKARDLARGQLIAIGRNSSNEAIAGTLVQTAGALDALYAEQASAKTLGITYTGNTPTLSVWAPTALKDPGVSVNVFDANGVKIETRPMTLDDASGVWSVTGTDAWDRSFYTISLKVYSYATNSIVTNEVTDPYSVSLSMDSTRSQFIDLDDAEFKPTGWDSMTLPPLDAPEDLTLYELHVRDFSIEEDPLVPVADKGKFTAFDIAGTRGRQHLQELAEAGLTAVHILPAFDIATVKENPADRVELDDTVEKLCAKNAAAAELCSTNAGQTIREAMQSTTALTGTARPNTQQIQQWLRDLDGFNWGYDPLHFGAPEGSYSTDPTGTDPTRHRVLEFRRMVKGLRDLELRTVMDVVYNHTNASGQNGRATLDRLVPGYYHRRNIETGNVLKDSCCDDTATEFRMMAKLMIDTGVRWVRDYKVAGFRFDLMSFHTLDVMKEFQAAVKAVEPSVYIYGEGWNFGAIQDDKRFTAARQANMGGTGIGSFSDRLRDPTRGGGPFDSGSNHVLNQGFISGWFYDPNALNSGSAAERDALVKDTDNIRLWLAGGGASYRLVNYQGNEVLGSTIDYRGQKSGYTKDPQEAITYISKHDNETLWDISQYKHPAGTPLADRVRADSVGMSMILLGQSIPFWQAGTEILRSKSMDRNSYDSGDWYNAIDWTMQTSRWNQGLPLAGDNSGNFEQILQIIQDTTAAQDLAARQRAFDVFKDFLKIRYSSPLFRLRTQAQIDQRVSFLNTGTAQIPGLVAMQIDGCTEPGLVPSEGALLVVFNATDGPRTLNLFGDQAWTLHPILAASVDPTVRTARHDANGFFVPARTTAVFRRTAQSSCAPFPRDVFVRGVGTDWAASPANQFQFLGGTIYEVTKTLAAGQDPDGFKIADADWTSGTDCGAEKPVVFGEPLTLACQSPGNGNINMFVDLAGNYVFRLDAASTTNPALTVRKAPAFPRAIYVRGINEDWGATATTLMQQDPASNVYRVVLNAPAGLDNEGFKIADAGWTSGTDCGSSTPVTIGQPLTLACAGPGNGNIAITFPTAGTYLFALDATNPAAPQLTVEKTPFNADLYVRGVGADWDATATNRMTYLGGGQYRLRRAATIGADADGFKIASSDWSTADCGSTTALTIGQPLPMVCNAAGNSNIAVTWPATGTYTFSLNATNASTPQLTVTGP